MENDVYEKYSYNISPKSGVIFGIWDTCHLLLTTRQRPRSGQWSLATIDHLILYILQIQIELLMSVIVSKISIKFPLSKNIH